MFVSVKRCMRSEETEKKYSISKCSQDISGQVDKKLFLFALCFSLLSSFSTVSVYYLIYQKQNNSFKIIK